MRKTKNKKQKNYLPATSPHHYRTKRTIIPIEIIELQDNSYHMIVKVEIDGIPGDMIIDTGASVTVVDREIFPDKIDNESIGKIQSGSVTGQINEVHLLQAGLFKIGGRKMKDIQLAAIDLSYVNDMYDKHLKRKIIGLLGCDFCVRYDVIIDYGNKQLSINFPAKKQSRK